MRTFRSRRGARLRHTRIIHVTGGEELLQRNWWEMADNSNPKSKLLVMKALLILLARVAQTRQLTGPRFAKREFLEVGAQGNTAVSPNGLPESQTAQNDTPSVALPRAEWLVLTGLLLRQPFVLREFLQEAVHHRARLLDAFRNGVARNARAVELLRRQVRCTR